MRLISMHVDNFGGLHEYDYIFEDGLNVVLQDNGWGKTTMAAFLKAMLYGFESKRTKDITENERKRYLPWQGGIYGGTLDFEAGGVNYRVTRTFGETPRYDKTQITNLDTNMVARIAPDRIGESLFKLDANAFQRSVFINQNGLFMDGAASSIHTRLNALLSQANDVGAFDEAIKNLTQQTKVYEKIGSKGQIADITRQIERLEIQRAQLEQDIVRQDEARNRVIELDTMIGSLTKDLEEKKKKLDALIGEEKKKEASKKVVEDLDNKIQEIVDYTNAIKRDLGGNVPTLDEIDQIKNHKQMIDSLNEQLGELEEERKTLSESYNSILQKYHGGIPTKEQLDELQGSYSELQGALSDEADKGTDDKNNEPEGYTLICKALNEDIGFLERLMKTVHSLELIQQQMKKLESLDREIQSLNSTWEDWKKRYQTIKGELTEAYREAATKEKYSSEYVGSAILKLEELQDLQRLTELKKRELENAGTSTAYAVPTDDTSLLLPDENESNDILNRITEVSRKQNEIQGLAARLDGERSKELGLNASLQQINSVTGMNISVVDEPKKPASSALIIVGAVLAVIGIVLAITVNPVMAILIVLGAALGATSFVFSNKYKTELRNYEAYRASAARQTALIEQRNDFSYQLQTVHASVASYENRIAELRGEIQTDQNIIEAWFLRWGEENCDRTEAELRRILNNAEVIRTQKLQQERNAEKQNVVIQNEKRLKEERVEIDSRYPELTGYSCGEALSILRAAETDYRVLQERIIVGETKLKQLIDETGISEEQFLGNESPRAESLILERNKVRAEVEVLLDETNKTLSTVNLYVDTKDVTAALRKVEQYLAEYKQYSERVNERSDRLKRRQVRVDELQKAFDSKLVVIQGCYDDISIPERITKVREDISSVISKNEKQTEIERKIGELKTRLEALRLKVEEFLTTYGCFNSQTNDIFSEICARVSVLNEREAALKELNKQKGEVIKNLPEGGQMTGDNGDDQRILISELEERRDSLLVEYTQKSDFIRQADESLERYPDILREIHQLYEKKQKAQNKLVMLKRTIQLISKAKENLADRYLSRVEASFNEYIQTWLNNEKVRGILDIDFKITIEEDDKKHVAEGYSTGYCDLIDFCMRMALVDTLFEKEQPFLIMDDPFVNLDSDRLDKAIELLNVMSLEKQVVYFVCHPIRAVEADENSTSRAEFAEIAESARRKISERKFAKENRNTSVRKKPRDLYILSKPDEESPIMPQKTDYTITNSIFSLDFVMNDAVEQKDTSYEVFFIDGVGRVLNERQIIEVKSGKLSTDRIQFCLNTRDDSGEQYELMVRETGQDDYSVIARFPYKVKLAFAGTVSFDF